MDEDDELRLHKLLRSSRLPDLSNLSSSSSSSSGELPAQEPAQELLLYRDEKGEGGFIKLTDAYPGAKYYPEIVNGLEDFQSYQNYLAAFPSPSELRSPERDPWMLVYSPDSGSSGAVDGGVGHFDLVLANGSHRRVANSPDEVCRLVGENNIFIAGMFGERKVSGEDVVCGGKVYHTNYHPPPSVSKEAELKGEGKGELQSSFSSAVATNELPNQPLRIYAPTLPTSYPMGRAAINELLSVSNATYWPKELLHLIQGFDTEQCSALTDSGRKCSEGSLLLNGHRSFDFPSASVSGAVDVDCTQTCTREDCPIWISPLVSQFPDIIVEYPYAGRVINIDLGTEYRTYLMDIVVEVSDLLYRKRSLKFSKRRQTFDLDPREIKWQLDTIGVSDSSDAFNTPKGILDDAGVVQSICKLLAGGSRFDNELTITTQFSAQRYGTLSRSLPSPVAVPDKYKFFTKLGVEYKEMSKREWQVNLDRRLSVVNFSNTQTFYLKPYRTD